jgi:hypothetical protein
MIGKVWRRKTRRQENVKRAEPSTLAHQTDSEIVATGSRQV